MFAIVDIETCGSSFSFQRGRIIDICILVHDGIRVIDKFSTLINPDCPIGGFYTNISGITNQMVEHAPRFHEVAKDIISYTEDKIFVAHNVGFDYTFIKEEFASLGYKFKRDTLCTVKMSRKLLPGKKSYSLGNLCDSLGITIHDRHRAEGDAIATAKVLDILLQLKTQNPTYRSKSLYQMMATKTEAIKKYILDKIPDSCGVYYFLNEKSEIIYIGKSVNMYTRALSHYNSDIQKTRRMLHELMNVDFIETGSELISLLLENIEIKKHQPQFNRRSKAPLFTHGIRFYLNEDGLFELCLEALVPSKTYLLSFTHYATAREKLDSLIERNRLCYLYTGLSESAPCFAYQLRLCDGVCAGEEPPKQYNKKVKEIIENYSYPHADFVILEQGRTVGETAFVCVRNYTYAGYGYMDDIQSMSTIQDFLPHVESSMFYPDMDTLIRGYLKSKKAKLVMFN
jgi:DNA polymerase-3 subunit epsilon